MPGGLLVDFGSHFRTSDPAKQSCGPHGVQISLNLLTLILNRFLNQNGAKMENKSPPREPETQTGFGRGPQMDPNGPQMDSQLVPDEPQMDPGGPQMDPKLHFVTTLRTKRCRIL